MDSHNPTGIRSLVELLESSICPILRGTSTHLSFPAQIRLWLEFHELVGHPKPLKTSLRRPRPQIPTEGYLCACLWFECKKEAVGLFRAFLLRCHETIPM